MADEKASGASEGPCGATIHRPAACPKCGSPHLPEAPCNVDADGDGQVDGVFPADEPGDRDDRARLLLALADRPDEKIVPARYWPFLADEMRDFARAFAVTVTVPSAAPRTVLLSYAESKLLDAHAITHRDAGWIAFASAAPDLGQIAHEYAHLCGLDDIWAVIFDRYVRALTTPRTGRSVAYTGE